jgi:hypothetical protein
MGWRHAYILERRRLRTREQTSMRGHDEQNSGSELTRRGFIAAAGAAGMANLAFAPPPATTRVEPANALEVGVDQIHWREIERPDQLAGFCETQFGKVGNPRK